MENFDFRIYTKRNDIKNNMCVVKDFYGDEIICEHEYRFKFSEVELMQFTGLKDRNGVKIYEGDIVSHPNPALNRAEVKFTKGLFRIVAKDGRDELLYYCYDIVEVIGNIHQNKDLLK